MQHAIELAKRAEQEGEVPVGAVMVKNDEIIAEGWNRPIVNHDPTAHAEIQVMRAAAAKLGNYRLPDTTLYVTLEPCLMCIGAIIHARIKRVVFGATDPRAGAVQSVYTIPGDRKLNHYVDVDGGIMSEECGQLLRNFFRQRRS
ncbi:MAG: tRNA adenosine(34) deaminase TadA [Sulfuriflexus sp.]|nr:tRNA adenosine(34) deaminase TadA [Sulfuriflexus sp.]